MRTALVTGSASGLGAAIRIRLESDGWTVIGADLHDAEITADLATPAGREAMVAAVTERAGDGLQGAVACAGLGPTVPDHGLIVGVNHFAAAATLDGVLPLLVAGRQEAEAQGGWPAAVAIASNSIGLIPPDEELLAACQAGDEARARARAVELDGPTVYGTSKRAIAQGVRHRAPAWGEAGVRLNAVAPGPVATPLLQATYDDPELGPTVDLLPIPIGRIGRPDEIASIVHFLLGPQSSLVHGAVLWADGGTDASVRPEVV
jgi:NAD(P)-dependent dehydrogenase (short-subunit alcohol dehydrogenase family)